MKSIDFLKHNYISTKGIYDNLDIYENTLEAYKNALDKDFILYLKVRLTKDNIMIVYNDNDLTRLMNLKDKISTTTYEELCYLNKYHIPKIEEVLSLISGKVPILINPNSTNNKFYMQKELSLLLDKYQGDFAIVNANPRIIKWFNINRKDYVIGEIITKNKKLNILNFITYCTLDTDFKSIDLKYYDILKMKKLTENNFVIGYLADTKDKFDIYNDVVNNLFIDNIDINKEELL